MDTKKNKYADTLKIVEYAMTIFDLHDSMTGMPIGSQFTAMMSGQPFQVRNKESQAICYFTQKILDDSESGKYQIGAAQFEKMDSIDSDKPDIKDMKRVLNTIKDNMGDNYKGVIEKFTREYILECRSKLLTNTAPVSVSYKSLVATLLECCMYIEAVVLKELDEEIDKVYGSGFSGSIDDFIKFINTFNK